VGTYSLAGPVKEARRVLLASAVVTALAVTGFGSALLFAHGAADSQTRFLPPIPTASERP
jgi:hypothetical protein